MVREYMDLLTINDGIFKTINIIAEKRLADYKKYPRCYYQDGYILNVNEDGTYDVVINTETQILKARQGLTLVVGNIVWVCVVNGNSSNKYIIDIRV